MSLRMPRLKRCIRWSGWIACAIPGVGISSALATGLPWEIWESPARLARLDAADQVIEQSSHCPQGCRYDRSNAGFEDPPDNPTPQRWLYRDGEEVVLFDERGPGALTRVWMTSGSGVSACFDPSLRIRFYIDGNAAPVIDMPLSTFFDGAVAPFTPPLVANRQMSSGGFVSRVPIAYTQSLRVALIGADNGPNPCTGSNQKLLWYQFTAHRLAQGSTVTNFSLSEDFSAWRAFLDHPGDDPWSAMLAPLAFSEVLEPGESQVLATRNGAGWLRGIRLQLAPDRRAEIRLRISIDNETAVDMTLTDFFASSSTASLPAQSLFIGQDSVGRLFSWWPMPYAQSVSVELVAAADLSAPTAVSGFLAFDNAPVASDAGRFRATLADSCVGGGDIEMLEERGAGKIVGISVRYRGDGSGDRSYLEGDERVVLDGAVTPTWYGTGAEDFFDAGFYFDHGEFSSPFSGASEVDADGSGTTAAYRIFATDPILYSHSIRWTQEAGLSPSQPVPMCARRVIYRYHRDQALTVSYGRFEVGDAAQAAAHTYQASPSALCSMQSGLYSDEPPSARMAVDCRYASGFSSFTFSPVAMAGPLRLRRTFDAAYGMAGSSASASAAEVRVNGVSVGWFPPASVNRTRRWQEQEIQLPEFINTGELHFTVAPLVDSNSDGFGESAWELLGGWVDPLFSADFEAPDSRSRAQ
jgi:hypothetical protein